MYTSSHSLAYTTALFDMDGVLVDSRVVMELAWLTVCRAHNLDVPFHLYLEHVGKPFETILEAIAVPSTSYASIKATYGYIAASNSTNITTYPGVQSVLKILKHKNFKIGIVTSKQFWRADVLIDQLLIECDVLVTPELTKAGKPSPDPLLYALKELNVSSADAFYVGDMKSDLQSAKAAGISFFKANWGYGNFQYSGVCLDSIEDLLELLSV
jgi:HAD superfamily hydrolase (TIGR01549 family)